MKKHIIGIFAITAFISTTALAQTEEQKEGKIVKERKEIIEERDNKDDSKKEKREIVIRKKGDGKAEKMTIVVDGDQVTINGKPVQDYKGGGEFFKDGDIDVDIDGKFTMPFTSEIRKKMMKMYSPDGNKAFLGVTSEKTEKGAKINEVIKGSAAEKAGLKEGDIITAINDDKINEENTLIELIGKYKPEDVVDVTVLRDGREKKFKATLGKNNQVQAFGWIGRDGNNFNMPGKPGMPFNFNWNDGDDLAPYITHDRLPERPKFGFSIKDNENGDGVIVTDVKEESNAAKAGLKKDDIVTGVNDVTVKNTDDLKKELAQTRDKSEVKIKILRNGNTQTLTVKVPKKIKTADL